VVTVFQPLTKTEARSRRSTSERSNRFNATLFCSHSSGSKEGSIIGSRFNCSNV
jgi:hypothetical protein